MAETADSQTVTVQLTEQQLELVDRLAGEWQVERSEVIARGVEEFTSTVDHPAQA